MKPKKLGRYNVVAELGSGAMGTVYKAIDPKIGRTVALKVLHFKNIKEGSDSLQARERFMVEARATGQLSHPNILTIFDVGEEDDHAYIAMEYLEGGTLEDIIQEGRFKDYDEIFDITGQIAKGLTHAHSRNIIHRDVKPANIMMAEGNVPKIADFGLARFTDSNLTTTGTVLGTPNYMSPEQIRGRKIDGRSDLFALGIILYEMLTGEKPFSGDSITSVIYRVVNEEPIPPKQLNMDLPDYMDSFVAKALAKNPDKRFQDGMKFTEGLKGMMSGVYSADELGAAQPGADQSGADQSGADQSGADQSGGNGDAGKTQTIKPIAESAKSGAAAASAALADISAKLTESITTSLDALHKKSGLPTPVIIGAALLVAIFFFSLFFSTMNGDKHLEKKVAALPPEAKVSEPATVAPKVRAKADESAASVKKPSALLPSAQGPAALVPAVEEKKAVLKTALLSIRSKPTGAAVYIDGKLAGKTPYLKKERELGKSNIKVTLKGYKADMFTLDLKKDRELMVKLQKPKPLVKTALLSVRSEPTGADVYIDGKLVGKTPHVKGKYRKKELNVQVTKEGYKGDEFKVNLKKNRELMVKLEKLETVVEEEPEVLTSEKEKVGFFTKMFKPKKAGNIGTLIVNAKPGDRVTIDGRKYREFPVKLENIPIGKHNVFIVRKGKKPFLESVILGRGETLTIDPEFK